MFIVAVAPKLLTVKVEMFAWNLFHDWTQVKSQI